MVFALMVASLTRDGSDAFVKLADDDATKITYVLEMLLCYWAWLKLDTFWDRSNVEQYESVKDAVSTLLGELISCVPRETGNGWDIPKIHEQLHIPCYIQMFGAHRNLHTGPAENNHIALSKKPAARTQKRSHVFDWQVSNRLIINWWLIWPLSRWRSMWEDRQLFHVYQRVSHLPPQPSTYYSG
jgi:hypothetical protein